MNILPEIPTPIGMILVALIVVLALIGLIWAMEAAFERGRRAREKMFSELLLRALYETLPSFQGGWAITSRGGALKLLFLEGASLTAAGAGSPISLDVRAVRTFDANPDGEWVPSLGESDAVQTWSFEVGDLPTFVGDANLLLLRLPPSDGLPLVLMRAGSSLCPMFKIPAIPAAEHSVETAPPSDTPSAS